MRKNQVYNEDILGFGGGGLFFDVVVLMLLFNLLRTKLFHLQVSSGPIWNKSLKRISLK